MVRIDESKFVNVITHPAPHHADEVFATAMLGILFPLNVLRTRDLALIEDTEGAIVYDVGGVYDPARNRFDHHQRDFVEARPDGTKYASAGLIWLEYGARIVKKLGGAKILDDEMAHAVVALVDASLIRGIDARDNGQGEKGDSMSVSGAISIFNALWDEEEDDEECFEEAAEIASKILRREIRFAISSAYGRKLTEERIESSDGPIMVMDQFIGGWLEAVLQSDSPKAADLLYTVFQGKDGNWDVQAIPPSLDDRMGQRKPFPEEWRGLRDSELARASGVESAVFCHVAGFFAVAETKEDAILLAEKAANAAS